MPLYPSWIEISVADLERALRFYRAVFGLDETPRYDAPPAEIVLLLPSAKEMDTPGVSLVRSPSHVPGGAFSSRMEAKDGSMGFDFAGTYTQIEPHRLIAYTFGDREAQVAFVEGPDGVQVRVTFDSEPTHSIEQQRDGWQAILNRFAQHVEARQ
jgi:catechol 2,3-dioxygenase-like lactoylglutathione lyase family enzyme